MIGLVRRLVRLGLVGLVVAWVVEQALRTRRGPDAPPPPFQARIVLDAPIERVWDALVDIEAQPRWMREMVEVHLLTPPPVRVGTRGEATVRILGLTVTDPVEITELDPPHRFAIRHEGLFTGGGVIELQAGADGTTTIVRWDETLIAPLLPHLWARASVPVMEHLFQGDLERFRELIESGELPQSTPGEHG
jgi:uncharacterized protein YndB with AHSA1/START domain